MGKYVLLITFATALGVAVIMSQARETSLGTNEDQVERQEKVLARQIARSAFNIATSKIKQDFEGWRVSRTGVEHDGGAYDVIAEDIADRAAASIQTTGYYGESAYRVSGEAVQGLPTALFNAVTVEGEPDDFDVSGPGKGPNASGIDRAEREDRHGITLPGSMDSEEMCEKFKDQVEGRSSDCDVVSRGAELDEWITEEMEKLKSEIESLSAGEKSVCHADGSGCDLKGKGNHSGSGILHVKGDLVINGQYEWSGLVFVEEGAEIRINGGGNATNVNGSLLMEEGASFDMNGGRAIQYNSDEILKLVDRLPTAGTEEVEITGRSGDFVEP